MDLVPKKFYSEATQLLLSRITVLQDDEEEDCFFCEEDQHCNFFNEIILEALYLKYPSSQYYYYTIEINNLLNDVRNAETIMYYDIETYIIDLEYLKSYYNK